MTYTMSAAKKAPTRRRTDTSTQARLAQVETDVAALGSSVSSLSDTVIRMSHDVAGHFDKIEAKLDAMNADNKPQWGAMAAWATFLIVLASAFGGLTISAMKTEMELRQKIDQAEHRTLQLQIQHNAEEINRLRQ